MQQEVERSFRKWEREGNQRDRGEAFEVICLADVEAKPVDWLWPLRLARGKVTILSGDPGMGKSQIALDTAARITTGDCWADSGERSPVGNVVIFSAEDALDDTVVPRLGAAGGDVQRVHAVKMVTDRDGKRRAVNLRADLDKLRALVEEIGNVLLVIIDPISAYLGDSIDSKQTFSVNPVLMMVADFADQARCAVFVVHHPPKETPKKAIHALSGSLAFAGGPRVVLAVVQDQLEDRNLLLTVKCSVGGASPPTIGYRVVNASYQHRFATSMIEWDDTPLMISADEALRAAAQSDSESKLQEAMDFLEAELGTGDERLHKELVDAAKVKGIRERTLRRAAERLNIHKQQTGFHGGWSWSLPSEQEE